MFYYQKVARVRVFADIQNFALRAHCVHGIPIILAKPGGTISQGLVRPTGVAGCSFSFPWPHFAHAQAQLLVWRASGATVTFSTVDVVVPPGGQTKYSCGLIG